jgi:outer membrane receptor protein involved in Fe transport
VGNYSRVISEVTQKIGNRIQTTPFQGQSTYSGNAGLFYKHKRWEGSVLYKAFGRRLEAYGVGIADIYEYPPQSLDVALNYQVSPSLRIKLGAENLLDQTAEFKTGDLVTQSYKSGRTIGFQVAHTPGF